MTIMSKEEEYAGVYSHKTFLSYFNNDPQKAFDYRDGFIKKVQEEEEAKLEPVEAPVEEPVEAPVEEPVKVETKKTNK